MEEVKKKSSFAESFTVPLWIYNVLLHLICGTAFLIVSNPDYSFSHVIRFGEVLKNETQNAINTGNISSVQNIQLPPLPSSLTIIFYLGLAHFLIGIISLVVILLGHLILPKFLALLKFTGILQSLVCIGTTVAIESVMGKYHEEREYRYENRLGSDAKAPESFDTYEHKTVVENAGNLLMASAITIAILSAIAFTASVKRDSLVLL